MTKDDCEHCPDSALEALMLKIEKLENQIRDIQFDIKCLEGGYVYIRIDYEGEYVP